jgi:hypothetical protein
VRRLSCAFAALLLIAPAGLRVGLAGTASDADALRCAIACGHALKAGAVCCPMDGGGGGLAMTSCPSNDSAGAVPVASGQPAILTAMRSLSAPECGDSPFPLAPAAAERIGAERPDPIPKLLS